MSVLLSFEEYERCTVELTGAPLLSRDEVTSVVPVLFPNTLGFRDFISFQIDSAVPVKLIPGKRSSVTVRSTMVRPCNSTSSARAKYNPPGRAKAY